MPLYLEESSGYVWARVASSLVMRADPLGNARLREDVQLTILRPSSEQEVLVEQGAIAWFPNQTLAKDSKNVLRTADHCVIFWGDGEFQLTLKKEGAKFLAKPVNLVDRQRALVR